MDYIWQSDRDVEIYSQDVYGVRYIIFPGTYSWQDWQTNLLWQPSVTPYSATGYKGKVKLHRGFYWGYLSIRDYFLNLCDTKLPIIIGGHSSGGAFAQIAGVDLNFRTDKKAKVFTFGTPAIGNRAWRVSAKERIDNNSYINLFDPIPWILPWNYHVNQPILNYNVYLNPHYIENYVSSIKISC